MKNIKDEIEEIKYNGEEVKKAFLDGVKIGKQKMIEHFKEVIDNLESLSFSWMSGGCDPEYCKLEWDRIKTEVEK
jgi:hypothetical protein